jgi:hypothetical protein
VLLSGVGYIAAGAGPLGGNYAPAQVTDHARQAQALAASLPPTAAVSASASLVPHLSHRPSVYVFPAVEDAAYVLLDLRASPAPTSAGDVFLRIRSLLARGGWLVQTASDGLLLLQRDPAQPPSRIEDLPADLLAYLQPQQLDPQPAAQPQHTYLDGRLSLLSATLEPAPSSVVAPNGVHGVLHTVWRAEQPLPAGTRLAFDFELTDGERLEAADLAPLWWRPPEHWTPGVPVAVDVPGVPMQVLADWQAVVSTPWNLRTEGRCLRPLTQAVSARSDP